MSKVPVIAEITTPFGSRRIPVDQVDWEKVKWMKQFYQSPEGLTLLADLDDEEQQFVQEQQEAGIASPTRIRFGLPTVSVRLLAEDGEVLTTGFEEIREEEEGNAG